MKRLLSKLLFVTLISTSLVFGSLSSVFAESIPFSEENTENLGGSVTIFNYGWGQTFVPDGNVITSVSVYIKNREGGEKLNIELWSRPSESENRAFVYGIYGHTVVGSGDGWETFDFTGKSGGLNIDNSLRYGIYLSTTSNNLRWGYSGNQYPNGFRIQGTEYLYTDSDLGFGVYGYDCTDTCESIGAECGYRYICAQWEYCGECGEGEICAEDFNVCEVDPDYTAPVEDEEVPVDEEAPAEEETVVEEETTVTEESEDATVTEEESTTEESTVEEESTETGEEETEDEVVPNIVLTEIKKNDEVVSTDDNNSIEVASTDTIVLSGTSPVDTKVIFTLGKRIFEVMSDENGNWILEIGGDRLSEESTIVNASIETDSNGVSLITLKLTDNVAITGSTSTTEESENSEETVSILSQPLVLLLMFSVIGLSLVAVLLILLKSRGESIKKGLINEEDSDDWEGDDDDSTMPTQEIVDWNVTSEPEDDENPIVVETPVPEEVVISEPEVVTSEPAEQETTVTDESDVAEIVEESNVIEEEVDDEEEDPIFEDVGPKQKQKSAPAEKKPEVKEEIKDSDSVESLDLGTKATAALEAAGYKKVEQVKELAEDDLLEIKGLGKKTVEKIFDAIE